MLFKNNPDFYPTPPEVAEKLFQDVDWRKINSVLEPSAGDGRLLDGAYFKIHYRNYGYPDTSKTADLKAYDMDAIEVEPNDYGKRPYEALAPEEKSVVDNFEGKNSYRETVARQSYFLTESNLLMLKGGESYEQ